MSDKYFSYEQPTRVDSGTTPGGRSYKLTHPAYGQISASRVSGSSRLYGSDFSHNHFVTIRINSSEQHHELSSEWHFSRKEFIEIAMSEAQWATFVSTMNSGSGVPCTFKHVMGEKVPQIAAPEEDVGDRFSGDLQKTLGEARERVLSMAQELNDAVGKKKAQEIKKHLEWVAMCLQSNTQYVADQFDRHMEDTVEKAKIEVNAYATSAIQRAGLEALSAGKPVVLLDAEK